MKRTSIGASLVLILTGVAVTGARAQTTWALSQQPTLVIGTVDGPAPSVFQDIRGVVTVDDTLVVVADGGSRELRVFTNVGGAVTTFGREGDGPREFRSIAWAERCGGSAIVVYDPHRRRVTRWEVTGNLLEGFNVESTEPSRPPYALSCGPAGDFAVVGWFDVLSYELGRGPYRPDTNVGVVGPDGRLQRVLGSFPGPERYRYSSDGLSDGPRPLGKSTIARRGSAGTFVGTGDSYEIEVFRTDGARFTLGTGREPSELTGDLLEAWLESILSRASPGNRPRLRRALDRYEMPATLPAYTDFRFDDLGLLWVALFPPPGQNWVQWDVWKVSDSGGVQVASVRTPKHFQPMDIGSEHVMGVSTDPLGVQRVHRYHLTR